MIIFGQFQDKGNKRRTQQYGITFRHYSKLLSFAPSPPPQKKTHTHIHICIHAHTHTQTHKEQKEA